MYTVHLLVWIDIAYIRILYKIATFGNAFHKIKPSRNVIFAN